MAHSALTTLTNNVATELTAFTTAMTTLDTAITTYTGGHTEARGLAVDAAFIAAYEAFSKWSKDRRYLVVATVDDAISFPNPGVRLGG